MKNTVKNKILSGERALFKSDGLEIFNCVFEDGESPLKESGNLVLQGCTFKWKYPLWYCKNVTVKNTGWDEGARAGVWYTFNVKVENAIIHAPKNFRKCDGVILKDVTFADARETLWNCKNVKLEKVEVNGDYFAMGCENLEIDGLTVDGNYCFDGAKNAVIRNAKLLSKDAFWNSENVTVYDSYISGEYLGWNAKNLTFINCTVESLQGLCYIKNLVMKNCKLINTTLAFEYSEEVDAEIVSRIDSVKNPASGVIRAQSIGELIMEEDKIDPAKTKICLKNEEVRTA